MSGRQRVNRPVQALAVAAVFGFALTLTGAAFAQPVEEAAPPPPGFNAAPPPPPGNAGPPPVIQIAVPGDPVARAAFDVLDRHCARCHQDGKLTARERPSKNFGNVLKLDEIAANPHFILPGNPFGSKLFKQIVDKEMPYDVEYEGETKYPKITPDELKALETWIVSLAATKSAACEIAQIRRPTRKCINLVVADLSRLPNSRKKGTRYLTLTHLKNACMDDLSMKVFRQGAIKLINSLSRSSDVVRLETIDPDESILRINLDDLGWDATDWDDRARGLSVQPAARQRSEVGPFRRHRHAIAVCARGLVRLRGLAAAALRQAGEAARTPSRNWRRSKASTSKATSSGSSRSVRASSGPASARTTA